MKNTRRHISSAFFGFLLLLPFLAIGFLQVGQCYIQSTREERLEKEVLVQVVLPAREVVWEEEEKELWVGDRMFDVASYSIIDGHYYLLGVYDDDETEVAGSLLHLLLSKNGTSFLQLLLLLQVFCLTLFLIDVARRHPTNQRAFIRFTSPLFSLSQAVLGPPPR